MPSPTQTQPRPAPLDAGRTAAPARTAGPTPDLGIEARLAATAAAMSVRLDEAAVAYEVNTSHIETDLVDWGSVITAPLEPAAPSVAPMPAPYPTPVAALLQRAHHRMLTGGWCSGALVDENGARCLLGAIRAEARGSSMDEAQAVEVLMDAIRRAFGPHVDSVPSFNDSWGNGRVPLRLLEQAAILADARGI